MTCCMRPAGLLKVALLMAMAWMVLLALAQPAVQVQQQLVSSCQQHVHVAHTSRVHQHQHHRKEATACADDSLSAQCKPHRWGQR